MAITISGENNNDKILASDGVIDELSGLNFVGVLTATSFTGDVTGNLTGNVTGNINNSTLLLQTGGYERIRIDSSGRVMIGTDTEGVGGADELTIANTSSSAGITLRSSTTATGNIYFSDGTSGSAEYKGVVRYDHNNNDMSFWTHGSEKLRISDTGKVGIGTDNPTAKLEIGNKTGDFINAIGIQVNRPHSLGLQNGVFVYSDVGYNASAAYQAAAFKAVGTGGNAFGASKDQGSNGLGGSLTSRIDFDGNATFLGKVGVGTNNPGFQLDVDYSGGEDGIRILNRGTTSGSTSMLRLGNDENINAAFLMLNSSGYTSVGGAYNLVLGHGLNRDIVFATGGTAKVRITGGSLVVGNSSLGAIGSFGVESNGHFRSILAPGNAGDTLLGAIYGVSNGFQINIDTSNNQVYKFHNGNSQAVTIKDNKLGILNAAPFNKLCVGNHTFSGDDAMFADDRVGISNHGNLTGLMLASVYNDATYPEYGLVFVQGPNTNLYNTWSISPDAPAKGNSLNFHFKQYSGSGSRPNIHHPNHRKFEFKGDGILLKPKHPCFRATRESTDLTITSGNIQQWNNVSGSNRSFDRYTDNGYGFNTSTHKYKIPVTGIWFFHVGVYTNSGNSCMFDIRTSTQLLQRAENNLGGSMPQNSIVSTSVVVPCNKDDEVYVHQSGGQCKMIQGSGYISFGGYLIA